jgi:hypothetical protein
MSKRKAILQVGYVEFITDITTALELEEKLCNMTQVSARWVDPDVDDGIVPVGLVWVPASVTLKARVEAKLLERNHSFVDDEEWYESVLAMREGDNDGDS